MSNVPRLRLEDRIRESNEVVTAILGARQAGKTELIRDLASDPANYFDLYRSRDAMRVSENPEEVLGSLFGIVVIDEVQEIPQVFRALRPLADRRDRPARFVLAGSASPEVVNGVDEGLPGRSRTITMGGFDLSELRPDRIEPFWLRGTYPRAFLAESDDDAGLWLENYLARMLGRDLPIWSGGQLRPPQLRRLLTLIGDATGKTWNSSSAATVLGVNYKTIQAQIEAFKGAFLVRELMPFHANVTKRIRKGSKLLLTDSGILHSLLLIDTEERLWSNPRALGASWETFACDQVIRMTETPDDRCFFWERPSVAELDLVIQKASGTYGFEFKASPVAKASKSIQTALDELELEQLFIVHAGKESVSINSKVQLVSWNDLAAVCKGLR